MLVKRADSPPSAATSHDGSAIIFPGGNSGAAI